MTWLTQLSRAVRRSSRAGSAPAATSIDRTWARPRPWRQRVERLVRDGAAGRDRLEGAAGGGPLQPVQHEVGAVDADEGLAEPVQFRCGGAVRRGEGLLQSPVQAAARAFRGRQLPGLLAGRAAFPEGRVGVEAAGAERLAQRASLQRRPGSAARAGDPALAAPLADRGAGRPRDADPAAVGRPADAAGKIRTGAAALADRPGLGDRGDAPAVPALRAGLPAPRVAVPAVLADGLPAVVEAGGWRTFPHRPQSTARALLLHPAQSRSPSTGTPSGRCLPQRGQGGSTTAVAPARASALMNRRTPGTGARAPSPVSSPGWAVTAAAMRHRPSWRAAACSSAPRTASALSPGSSSAIRASRPPPVTAPCR